MFKSMSNENVKPRRISKPKSFENTHQFFTNIFFVAFHLTWTWKKSFKFSAVSILLRFEFKADVPETEYFVMNMTLTCLTQYVFLLLKSFVVGYYCKLEASLYILYSWGFFFRKHCDPCKNEGVSVKIFENVTDYVGTVERVCKVTS